MSGQVSGAIKYVAALALVAAVVATATYFVIRMQVNTADLAFDAPVKKRSEAETELVESMRTKLREADNAYRGGMDASEGFGASAPAVIQEPSEFKEPDYSEPDYNE